MALKPEIQFDDQVKENVGLNQDADLKFVKDNPNPSPHLFFLAQEMLLVFWHE